MKKTAKILALVLAVSMLCIVFASCGKTISGTYKFDATVLDSGVVTTYKFSGSKVSLTVDTKVLGNVTSSDTFEGKYEIAEAESGDLQITFTFEDSDAEKYNLTQTFEEGDGTIKIGLVTYTKVD